MVWLHNVIWFGECLRWTEWTEKHQWWCFAQQWRNLGIFPNLLHTWNNVVHTKLALQRYFYKMHSFKVLSCMMLINNCVMKLHSRGHCWSTGRQMCLLGHQRQNRRRHYWQWTEYGEGCERYHKDSSAIWLFCSHRQSWRCSLDGNWTAPLKREEGGKSLTHSTDSSAIWLFCSHRQSWLAYTLMEFTHAGAS